MARVKLGRIVGSDLFGLFPQYLDLHDAEMTFHKHILGIAGSGKSRLLESLWLQCFQQGIGCTLVDPHGSSAEALLRALIARGVYANDPTAYTRIRYVEFADDAWMIPFNILKLPFASTYERVKLVVEAFKRVWPELAMASMFDSMMDASLKILIDNDYSIAALHEFLSDKDKRLTRYYPHAQDDLAVSWFKSRWDTLPLRDQMIEGGSIIRRAYLIVSSPVARLTLGQADNHLSFRDILDQEQAVIINLGRIKDAETRRLLGALLTHSFEIAALSRSPRTDLPPHQLMIDEFSQFSAQSSEALATMLDQTRKFGLFVTMAGQTFSQLKTTTPANDRLIGALANARVKISFLVGHDDAMTQARIFADVDPVAIKKEAASERGQPLLMSPQDQYEAWGQAFKTLPPRHALVRVGTKPAVKIATLDVPSYDVPQSDVDAVKNEYFQRDYVPRDQVVLSHEMPWNQGKPAQRVKP